MFERFSEEARDLVVRAVEHAIRLGHRYVGPEHILLAAVSTGQPASAVLRAHGVTPELVEEGIVGRVGLGAGAGLFGGLDKDALATIGIDLDAVRARIEASFGPQALARAAQAAHRDPRRRPGPRPPRVVREWRRRRRARRVMTRARAGSPAPGGDRPVLRAGSTAQRAHPVHPGHQEDPRGHPARGGRQARLADRGRAHRARPYHDQAGPRAPDPVRGGCPGGGATRRDPRPVPAGELTGYRAG